MGEAATTFSTASNSPCTSSTVMRSGVESRPLRTALVVGEDRIGADGLQLAQHVCHQSNGTLKMTEAVPPAMAARTGVN